MRRVMVAANFKLHKTDKETAQYLRELMANDMKDRDVLVCPSYLSLKTASDITKDSVVMIGAQDISQYEKGAYTGEVSGIMLKGFCRYVLVGHSERRHVFGDTDEIVREKLAMAQKNGIIPILCIGESAKEREENRTEEVLERQLRIGLQGVTADDRLIIAYEPVWAISSGEADHEPATPEIAKKAHMYIRKTISKMYSKGLAEKVRILYGGSVKPGNVSSFLQEEDVDGVLVGSASLDSGSFIQLINS